MGRGPVWSVSAAEAGLTLSQTPPPACHILECCEGLAQSVISTVGQAFELRFKQYLHSPPKAVAPLERYGPAPCGAWVLVSCQDPHFLVCKTLRETAPPSPGCCQSSLSSAHGGGRRLCTGLDSPCVQTGCHGRRLREQLPGVRRAVDTPSEFQ